MLNLRSAEMRDERLLLSWRNEPLTRAASFSSEEITLEEHHRWFHRKLADPRCALLIVEEDGTPIGQVRLDRVGQDLAEISIGLATSARGRGLGKEALRMSIREATTRLGVGMIKARVKSGNAGSLAAFAAAGFRVVRADDDSVELLHGSEVDPATR